MACNVRRKELSRDFRILHSRLDLKIPQQDPMKCIAKVADKRHYEKYVEWSNDFVCYTFILLIRSLVSGDCT